MAMDILHQSPEIKNWDEVKLLQVAVDRLEKWYDHGLLILGDAAHAMSPIGGLGINVAIQDSIAAGNILVPAFRRGRPVLADLAQFQKRREWVVKMTQWFQVKLQNNLIDPIVQGTLTPKLWLPLRLLRMFPRLSHIPARIIGLGIRPEHVDESLRFVATN